MTRDDALAELTLKSAPAVYPTLTQDELDALLDGARRYGVWAPSASYTFGDVVRPTKPNGHLYRCILAGTSSTTEPIWPLYTKSDDRVALTRPYWDMPYGPYPGSTVYDASTIWQEDGFDTGQQYDIRGAVYQAWVLKAGKATSDYDVRLDQDGYSRSQVVAHCHDMALRYLPTRIA